MDCALIPTRTVFSTPVVVETFSREITTVITIPGSIVLGTFTTTEFITTECEIRRQDCPYVTATRVLSTIYTQDAQEIITTYFTQELITSFGDPIPIETQFGLESSCLGLTSTPTPVPTDSGELALNARAISPPPTPRPAPTPAFLVTTLSSSMIEPAPSAARAAAVLPQNFHKVGTIAEAAAAGVVALVMLISFVFYFKYSGKGASRGKTQLQALHSREKDDDPDPEMGSAGIQEITCTPGQGPRGHLLGRNSSEVESSGPDDGEWKTFRDGSTS